MLKVGAATVAVIILGLFFLHSRHGSRAASVNSCLEKSGATVQQSTFFEDVFASAAAEQGQTLPEPMRKAAREVEKNMYDVRYGDASALLIFTKGGRQADTIELQASELSDLAGMAPLQRVGNVLVLWPEEPTVAASAAVTGCLA